MEKQKEYRNVVETRITYLYPPAGSSKVSISETYILTVEQKKHFLWIPYWGIVSVPFECANLAIMGGHLLKHRLTFLDKTGDERLLKYLVLMAKYNKPIRLEISRDLSCNTHINLTK